MIYHITSPVWKGFIEIEFNNLGLMTRTDTTNAELTEDQQVWFLKNCRVLRELEIVIKGTNATLTEVKTEITFEDIWNRYDYKVGKQEAQAKWNKMTKPEQIKAYNYIPKYKARKLETQAMLYLASYLNKQRWND